MFAAVPGKEGTSSAGEITPNCQSPRLLILLTIVASNRNSRTESCSAWLGAARSFPLGNLPCPKPFVLQLLIRVGVAAQPNQLCPSPACTEQLLGAPWGSSPTVGCRADGLIAVMASKLLCLWSSHSVGLVSGSVCCFGA